MTVAALALLATLFVPRSAPVVCTCALLSEAEAVRRADAVFVGRPMGERLSMQARTRTYTFVVSAWRKGAGRDTVEVESGLGGGDCGADFTIGRRVTVHAGRDADGRFRTSICNQPTPPGQMRALRRLVRRNVAPARRAFDRFLRGSLEQPPWVRRDPAALHQVIDGDCAGERGQDGDRSYWVASYRIINVWASPTEGTGEVEVLAAAEQGPDPHGVHPTRVKLDVRRHVLRFPLRRDERTGGWRVCPVSEGGYALGHDIIPHNMGTDPEVVFAAIDSIRGVRHRRWYPRPD